jgi:predicted transcriptional regulator
MNHPKLVKDIMVTKLVTLRPDSYVWSGIQRLLQSGITGAPVTDRPRQRYLGVFSEKCSMKVLLTASQFASEARRKNLPKASQFMVKKLVKLSPEQDVLQAIGRLLRKRISGAPVVDPRGRFLGVFSEKTSMKVVMDAAYDNLPTTKVAAFMDTDMDRVISDDTDMLRVIEIFANTPFRRLPVLRGETVVGQVSRRDVLRAAQKFVGADPDSFIRAVDESVTQSASNPDTRLRYVSEAMDTDAKTIDTNMDLLSIAQIYLTTPYRRLPVLDGEQLVGQFSRRDLLRAVYDMMLIETERGADTLYLSGVDDGRAAPV